MHEVWDVNIPAVLLTIVIVCVAYHLIWTQVKASEARSLEIRRLQQLAAEEVARVEREAAEEFRSAKLASEFQLSQPLTTTTRRKAEERRSLSFAENSLADDQENLNHSSNSAWFSDDSWSAPLINESSSSWITGESSSSAQIISDNQVISSNQIVPEESVNGQTSSLPPTSVERKTGSRRQPSFSESSRASASRGICIVCGSTTKKQCSRCKAVKYCSERCQVQHWREGHKHECHELEKQLLSPPSRSNKSYETPPLQPNRGDELEEHLVSPPSQSDTEVIHRNLAHSENSTPAPVKNSVSGSKSNSSVEKSSGPTSVTFQAVDPVATNGNILTPTRILFPYDDFVELFTWDELRLPPCGLINLGNSCYANVVLQCLTYTRPLAAYFLEGHHKKEKCQRSVWCFMCELKQHIDSVKKSRNPFKPHSIISGIPNLGNNMESGRQEDAHEFIRFAIDCMQSIFLDQAGGDKVLDSQTQETTLIQHIFGGYLRSQVRCMQCHHESYKYENMMDLAVEIQGSLETLEDALAQFTAKEWLDGDNKYKCNRCNSYVKAWKRLMIHEAPNILMIALKRFQSGKFGKLNKRVVFPNILDIASFMSKESDEPPCYELYGVVVHVDMFNASFFGHYKCYVKDFQGVWYKINDSMVKEVKLEKVLQQRAYMLFYKRLVPRSGPLLHGGDTVHSSRSSRATTANGRSRRRSSSFYRFGANGDTL